MNTLTEFWPLWAALACFAGAGLLQIRDWIRGK